MEKFPLPARVHYELLLEMLERQSVRSTEDPILKEQVQQLIFTIRKAYSQQKQLESNCSQRCIPIDYRWSMHGLEVPVSSYL
jgi:Family of unknown function (DUF5340)